MIYNGIKHENVIVSSTFNPVKKRYNPLPATPAKPVPLDHQLTISGSNNPWYDNITLSANDWTPPMIKMLHKHNKNNQYVGFSKLRCQTIEITIPKSPINPNIVDIRILNFAGIL